MCKARWRCLNRLVIADDDTAKIIDVGHEAFGIIFHFGASDWLHGRGTPALDCTGHPVHGFRRPLPRSRPMRNLRDAVSAHDSCLRCITKCLASGQYRDNSDLGTGAAMLRFPALAPGLRKYIERPPFSFSDQQLANAKNIPLDVHIELQRWLRKIHPGVAT